MNWTWSVLKILVSRINLAVDTLLVDPLLRSKGFYQGDPHHDPHCGPQGPILISLPNYSLHREIKSTHNELQCLFLIHGQITNGCWLCNITSMYRLRLHQIGITTQYELSHFTNVHAWLTGLSVVACLSAILELALANCWLPRKTREWSLWYSLQQQQGEKKS
jgi:hypothetical protein